MNITIRDERAGDETIIAELTDSAFRDMPYGDENDAGIPGRLRDAGALLLSLVAESDGEIVGHVAFSPAMVGDDTNWIGLGPLSVRPDMQKRGIGSRLLETGLARMRQGEVKGCVLVGDPGYYTRFGFCSMEGLTCDHVPAENTMALCFGDAPPKGAIAFHSAFFFES